MDLVAIYIRQKRVSGHPCYIVQELEEAKYISHPFSRGPEKSGVKVGGDGLDSKDFKKLFAKHKNNLKTNSLASIGAALAFRDIREAIDASKHLSKADLKVLSLITQFYFVGFSKKTID